MKFILLTLLEQKNIKVVIGTPKLEVHLRIPFVKVTILSRWGKKDGKARSKEQPFLKGSIYGSQIISDSLDPPLAPQCTKISQRTTLGVLLSLSLMGSGNQTQTVVFIL